MMTVRRPCFAILPAVWLTLAGFGPARAQVPDPPYRNLEVLPRDISRAELIDIMRGFSFAVGARCEDCHVGPSGGSLVGFDFPADDRPRKDKARAMLRMVRDINERQLAAMPGRSEDAPLVSCGTCHRGGLRPLLVEDTLMRVLEAEGVEAAVAEYRELHERHFGSGQFDFGARPLLTLAERLQPTDTAAAIAVLRLSAETHPSSLASHRALATLLLAAGDREGALFAAVRALELNPEDAPSRRVLDQVLGR